ncbi:MAG TPA: hypothetical protein VK947_13105 [Planococcus sp. (in: firmicutes)]|nr:hypothetical protein [Planococcus sp. (in: firmicutes)]
MIFLIVWLLLIGYTVFLTPSGSDPSPVALLTGDWDGIDALVIVVFNTLGIFPMVFLTLLLLNDKQKWPAWPFALLSFVVGAFSLLPYFAFGDRPAKRPLRTPDWLYRIVSSRTWFALILLIWAGNFGILLRGFSLQAYAEAFQSSGLVATMSVDWFVLWGLSIYTVHRFYPEAKSKVLAWVPVIGPILVLLVNRESLKRKYKA